MTLILKSDSVFTGTALTTTLNSYINRVKADGGTIYDLQAVKDALGFAETEFKTSAVFSATSPSWGYKADGDKLVKLYNLFDPAGDLVMEAGGFTLGVTNGVWGAYASGTRADTLRTSGAIATRKVGVMMVYEPNPTGPEHREVLGVSYNNYNAAVSGEDLYLRLIAKGLDAELGAYALLEAKDTIGGLSNNTLRNAVVSLGALFNNNKLYTYSYDENLSNYDVDTTKPIENSFTVFVGKPMNNNTGHQTTTVFTGNLLENWVVLESSQQQFEKIGARVKRLYFK